MNVKTVFCIFFCIIYFHIDSQINYSSQKGTLNTERFSTIHKDRHIVGYVSSNNISHKNSKLKSIYILDLNADEIFSFEIKDKSNFYLVETAYNGMLYAFLFLDAPSKNLICELRDEKGVVTDRIEKKLGNADIEYFISHVTHNNNYTGYNQFLHEIGKDGFILMLNTVEQNLNTCQIFKINSDTAQERVYTYMTESPIYEANFLGHGKNQMYFSFEINGKTTGQYFTQTIALNKSNLEQSYEVQQFKDQDYFFFPKIALASSSDDEVRFVGYYFDAEKNMDKDFYDGFAYWHLDTKGDFKEEKYVSFKKGINDLTFKNDNKGKDLGFLFLQNVFMDDKKNIYIVSEGYQKVAEGSSIGITAMGMGMTNMGNYTRVKTYDLALSQFDENFNYKGTQVIEKQGNTIQLSYLYSQPIFELGKLYNRYGMFDYLGTELLSDGFAIYFKNFRFDAMSGGTYKVGRFTKYATGRMDFTNIEKLPNTSKTYILPNVDGRVLFAEKIKKIIYFDFTK